MCEKFVPGRFFRVCFLTLKVFCKVKSAVDLDVNIAPSNYEFTQRALIDSIIDDVGLKDAKVKPVPAKVSLRIHAFMKGQNIFRRAGIEPATYGYLYHYYSPPLYQLSYQRLI